MMDEREFRERVELIAYGIAEAIKGDNPDLDTSFEVYVFTVAAESLLGYVYMGEAGEWAFVEDDRGGVEDAPWALEDAKSRSPYARW